jgi:ABC-2 type transport system ATP-binding protein
MSELHDTADHLVIAGRGSVIADTTVTDLIAGASGGRLLLLTTAPAKVTGLLRSAGVSVAAAAPDTRDWVEYRAAP